MLKSLFLKKKNYDGKQAQYNFCFYFYFYKIFKK